MYNLYSKFDIEKHKETYINYLEVIILPDGTIEYAVPSHQEKLIKIAMDKLKLTREELFELCPDGYYIPMEWLTKITGCVSVWNEFVGGEPNEIQKEVIEQLRLEGLLKDTRNKKEEIYDQTKIW